MENFKNVMFSGEKNKKTKTKTHFFLETAYFLMPYSFENNQQKTTLLI